LDPIGAEDAFHSADSASNRLRDLDHAEAPNARLADLLLDSGGPIEITAIFGAISDSPGVSSKQQFELGGTPDKLICRWVRFNADP
jgi:hypothetical protein